MLLYIFIYIDYAYVNLNDSVSKIVSPVAAAQAMYAKN